MQEADESKLPAGLLSQRLNRLGDDLEVSLAERARLTEAYAPTFRQRKNAKGVRPSASEEFWFESLRVSGALLQQHETAHLQRSQLFTSLRLWGQNDLTEEEFAPNDEAPGGTETNAPFEAREIRAQLQQKAAKLLQLHQELLRLNGAKSSEGQKVASEFTQEMERLQAQLQEASERAEKAERQLEKERVAILKVGEEKPSQDRAAAEFLRRELMGLRKQQEEAQAELAQLRAVLEQHGGEDGIKLLVKQLEIARQQLRAAESAIADAEARALSAAAARNTRDGARTRSQPAPEIAPGAETPPGSEEKRVAMEQKDAAVQVKFSENVRKLNDDASEEEEYESYRPSPAAQQHGDGRISAKRFAEMEAKAKRAAELEQRLRTRTEERDLAKEQMLKERLGAAGDLSRAHAEAAQWRSQAEELQRQVQALNAQAKKSVAALEQQTRDAEMGMGQMAVQLRQRDEELMALRRELQTLLSAMPKKEKVAAAPRENSSDELVDKLLSLMHAEAQDDKQGLLSAWDSLRGGLAKLEPASALMLSQAVRLQLRSILRIADESKDGGGSSEHSSLRGADDVRLNFEDVVGVAMAKAVSETSRADSARPGASFASVAHKVNALQLHAYALVVQTCQSELADAVVSASALKLQHAFLERRVRLLRASARARSERDESESIARGAGLPPRLRAPLEQLLRLTGVRSVAVAQAAIAELRDHATLDHALAAAAAAVALCPNEEVAEPVAASAAPDPGKATVELVPKAEAERALTQAVAAAKREVRQQATAAERRAARAQREALVAELRQAYTDVRAAVNGVLQSACQELLPDVEEDTASEEEAAEFELLLEHELAAMDQCSAAGSSAQASTQMSSEGGLAASAIGAAHRDGGACSRGSATSVRLRAQIESDARYLISASWRENAPPAPAPSEAARAAAKDAVESDGEEQRPDLMDQLTRLLHNGGSGARGGLRFPARPEQGAGDAGLDAPRVQSRGAALWGKVRTHHKLKCIVGKLQPQALETSVANADEMLPTAATAPAVVYKKKALKSFGGTKGREAAKKALEAANHSKSQPQVRPQIQSQPQLHSRSQAHAQPLTQAPPGQLSAAPLQPHLHAHSHALQQPQHHTRTLVDKATGGTGAGLGLAMGHDDTREQQLLPPALPARWQQERRRPLLSAPMAASASTPEIASATRDSQSAGMSCRHGSAITHADWLAAAHSLTNGAAHILTHGAAHSLTHGAAQSLTQGGEAGGVHSWHDGAMRSHALSGADADAYARGPLAALPGATQPSLGTSPVGSKQSSYKSAGSPRSAPPLPLPPLLDADAQTKMRASINVALPQSRHLPEHSPKTPGSANLQSKRRVAQRPLEALP